MKFISWNVNGIRSALNKGFLDFVEKAGPEMLCIQETKAHPEQVHFLLPDYLQYWNSARKRGYSGTAIFTTIKLLNVTCGMGIPQHDREGRVITMELPVVESHEQRAGEKHRLAHRLFLHLCGAAAALESGVYHAGGDGIGSLSGGDGVGVKTNSRSFSLKSLLYLQRRKQQWSA